MQHTNTPTPINRRALRLAAASLAVMATFGVTACSSDSDTDTPGVVTNNSVSGGATDSMPAPSNSVSG